MKLSSQIDLILVIILSIVVLLLSWLQLFQGYLFTFISIILILFLPGYSIITLIWPTDEKMSWGMRTGLGFVLGLFFLLFLPMILNSQNLGSVTNNLNNILFILATILALLAMIRRPSMDEGEELKDRETQLTLEEAIERAALMRQQPTEEHEDEYLLEHLDTSYDDQEETHEDEEIYPEDEETEDKREEEVYPEDEEEYIYPDHNEEDSPVEQGYKVEETPSEEGYEDDEEPPEEQDDAYQEGAHPEEDEYIYPEKDFYPEIDEESPEPTPDKDEFDEEYESWRENLKKQKPLQYERIQRKYEEAPAEHYPLRVDEPIKTDSTPSDYEQEMDKPVWMEEPPEKKPGFKYWDLLLILFLSGISLLFLYFNPLKTTSTSIIFFILLLFILGYAAITIIFPDKSRASTRNLILASGLIAFILFVFSFLACSMQLLPSMPSFCIQILFIASIVLVVGAFLRKWRTPQGEDDEIPPEEKVPIEDYSEEGVLAEEKLPEESPLEELEEKELKPTEKKDPFSVLKKIGEPEKKEDAEITADSETDLKRFFDGSRWEKALSIILIICIVLAIVATVYIIVTPKEGEKFTEFYIIGPNGTASNYPTNLTVGQTGNVIIGVVNHEYATQDYRVVVKINGNNTLKNDTITLNNNQKVEIPFNFTAGATGQKKMEFILYKLPDEVNPYRSLHLWLNIQ